MLRRALEGRGTDFTIADAATKAGIPLRDAERGLHALVDEYRGHLRVTEEGELLFRFSNGFTKPWQTQTRLRSALRAVGRGLAGIGRFIVRAWVAICLVGYAVLFIALILALTFARSSNSDSRESRGSGLGFDLAFVFFRVMADALFWTFHPFSPWYVHDWEPAHATGSTSRFGRREPKVAKRPFYERVNRFFFGPEEPPADPLAQERAILAEIRAQKGRIGLADVMRVTGLPRDQADPLMARLMLDYDGTVEVSEEGGISYRFTDLRKTVAAADSSRPEPVWTKRETLAPLTGNGAGDNLLIGGLNAFNLLASTWVIGAGLTLDKIGLLLSGIPLAKLPIGGTPIALGVVPLVFSIALFALPLVRGLFRPWAARRVARENGRRAVLRAVLSSVGKGGVSDDKLVAAWRDAAGREPEPKEITRQVVALGGDVDLEAAEGGIRYRFPDLEYEAKAVAAERDAAAEEEAKVGEVVFSSEADAPIR